MYKNWALFAHSTASMTNKSNTRRVRIFDLFEAFPKFAQLQRNCTHWYHDTASPLVVVLAPAGDDKFQKTFNEISMQNYWRILLTLLEWDSKVSLVSIAGTVTQQKDLKYFKQRVQKHSGTHFGNADSSRYFLRTLRTYKSYQRAHKS